jgi:transcriptional regulator with XRE-family HTH domain
MQTINEILKQARKDAGLSVSQIAEKLSVKESRVYHIENSSNNISRDTILSYANALDLDIEFSLIPNNLKNAGSETTEG